MNKCKWLIFLFFSCEVFTNDLDILSFAGFASQGITYTSDNQFFDEKDKISLNMTTLGLQANYLFNDQIRLSAQAMYRNWGKIDSTRFDFFMADYQFINQPYFNLGIRMGRIKSDLAIFNSTRDIPSARPSIFLPQSVYQDILRDTTTSYDGLSLYGNQVFKLGRLNWSIAYGRYPVSDDLSESILGKELSGDISTDSNFQLMTSWESLQGNWTLSLGYENPKANLSQLNKNNAAIAISPGNIEFERYIFSHQYFTEFWDLTFEYMYQHTTISGFHTTISGFQLFTPSLPEGFPQTEIENVSTDNLVNVGFYGQWRYLLTENLTFFFRYGRYFTDIDDKDGSNFQQESGMPSFSRYSHDLSSGIKWKILPKWQINFEGHFIEGTAAISPTIKLDHSANDEKNWQLWSLQVSYSF